MLSALVCLVVLTEAHSSAEARNGSLLMTWQPRMPVPDGLVAFNSVNNRDGPRNTQYRCELHTYVFFQDPFPVLNPQHCLELHC